MHAFWGWKASDGVKILENTWYFLSHMPAHMVDILIRLMPAVLQVFIRLVGCRLKANCPLVGSEPIGDVPSVDVFLRGPSPYLFEFRRKPRKTLNC